MTRVFLVDDHPMVRGGLRAMLAPEPDLLVVGEAGHGQELLDQLPATPTDVVLLDLNMPVLDGLATTQRLRVDFPQVKVLVLSAMSHERGVVQLFEAGARGYVLKNDESDEIALAIRTVAAGRHYLCSELGLRLARQPASAALPNPYQFSPRELEVLQLLAEGLTNGDIAGRLGLSKRTVETHRQHLLATTHTRNAAALVRLAVALGMVR